MAAKAAGGKKGKKKGTTMALTDFLSDETGSPAGPGTSYVLSNKPVDSWAAEMEDLDIGDDPTYGSRSVDRTKLPTAPKAARGVEDLERVPKDPPFTAFIGNLPYEVSDEKIEEFFKDQKVVNVRLPEDSGRFRGFGYVQFETRQDLIDAMAMSDEVLGGRKVRVDLAGQDRDKDGNQRSGGRNRDDGEPDRTEGQWRRTGPSQDSGYDDRGPSRGGYEDRGSRGGGGYEDRGASRADTEDWGARRGGGGGGFEDRGSRGGYDDRGSRGGGGYEDRGSRGGYEDRGSRGGFDRDDFRGGSRGFDDRGGRGGYEERGSYDRRGGGGYGRDRYDDRDGGDGRRGGGGSYGYRRDEDRGSGGGGFGRDRGERGGGGGFERNGYERRGDDRYGGYSSRPERQESREEAKERPRLQLQKRSKPAESADGTPSAGKASSIFGAAKPVDTAQREKEIEEKLRKQKTETPQKSSLESRGYGESRGYDAPRGGGGGGGGGYQEAREPRPNPWGQPRGGEEVRDGGQERRYEESRDTRPAPRSERSAPRRRSDSDKSQDGDVRRERHSSSGSNKSGKGKKGPRRDSDQSGEVFSGGEDHRGDDRSHNAVTTSPPGPGGQHREDPAKLVPAPPPKENIWEKRKSTQPAPQRASEEPRSPPVRDTPPQSEPSARSPPAQPPQASKPQHNSPPQSQPVHPSSKPAPASDGKPREFVPAKPPSENPWARRKTEMEQKTPSGGPGSGAGVARGGGGDRGRGGRGAARGGFGRGKAEPPRPKDKKERPIPTSIDEMPKLEQSQSKDFSDGNKFAGLLPDEDDGGDDS